MSKFVCTASSVYSSLLLKLYFRKGKLVMSNLSEIIPLLPPMKSGSELLSALEVLSEYDAAICDANAPVRLMALSDLYRVYVPSQMSLEIYSKLYLTLMRSLQKKGSVLQHFQLS